MVGVLGLIPYAIYYNGKMESIQFNRSRVHFDEQWWRDDAATN